jgi:2-C-methyl-D-erythritol 4-phosphate cytidylyltransferase
MQPRERAQLAAAAIIVAAGRGERFGAPDKVFLPLGGHPLLAHVLDATEQAKSIQEVVLVVGEHTRATSLDLVAEGGWNKVRAVVTGGPRRQDSVEVGLNSLSSGTEVVAIHDGARPLATSALFDACVATADVVGAAIAAAPITDTLKRVAAGKITETIPREHLWAAQTPQAFRVELLIQAFAFAAERDLEVTDEASMLEAMGVAVAIVPSTSANLKITHQDDLWLAEALYAHRQGVLPEIEP